MKIFLKTALAALGGAWVLQACNPTENPLAYNPDTHGRGKAKIYFEESFKPLFETSIYTFESLYPKADIVPVYGPENKIIESFYKDETKTICITRDFTDQEKADLKKSLIEVVSDKIAEDAVTLIVNPENVDTLLTVDQLKRILKGEDKTWPTLKTTINVVFDNKNSANFNYMRKLCENAPIPVNVFAVESNEQVIDYVKKNKSALGVIGLNWISDEDDADVLNFLNGIKVVSVAKAPGEYYHKPYQGYVYTKEYPLTREVWMINKAKKTGLNTGFVLFMIGDKGQTIIQKSSLVPASTPVRLIQMSTEGQ